jgi:4-amino-4-deoxy-L-arabinose transferase-like glycosyltransferase
MLATMGGFVELSHWIRIDALLVFTITVSILLFLDSQKSFHPAILVGAYIFAAMAFMTKGLVGIALIAPPWIAGGWMNWETNLRKWKTHLSGFFISFGIILAWMLTFRRIGGIALFNEWFWDNQIGRFLGRTPQLGHIHGPFYYLEQIWGVLFPWGLILLAWMFSSAMRRKLREAIPMELLVPLGAWAFAGLLVLSASGTKRTIYLFPLMPAYAILFAASYKQMPLFVHRVFQGLIWLLASACVFLSLTSPSLQGSRLDGFVFHLHPAASALSFLAIVMILAYWRSLLKALVTGVSVFYIVAILTMIPVFENFKNYRPYFLEFSRSIPLLDRSMICGYNLDQTTQALFPYYTGWFIPVFYDEHDLASALNGTHKSCSELVVQMEDFIKQNPQLDVPDHRTIFSIKLPTGRILALVEGANSTNNER